MPQKGHKTIMVSEMVYDCAKKLADGENKSVAGKVTEIIEKECNQASEEKDTEYCQ